MIDFNNSDNKIYNIFFNNNKLVAKWNEKGLIHKTYWQSHESDNSFSLKDKNTYRNAIPEILEERFGILDKILFEKKYQEAISGDGQEWKRITTLHSSSLIALLCFYSISKNNPIDILDYTFEESYFEVKTQVYQDSESNMDVVLRGKDKEGNKVVLFLECKFSEYLNTGKYHKISKAAYEQKYKELGLFDVNPIANIRLSNPEDGICIAPQGKKAVYCGGIKQMLSHYIGVSNYSINRDKVLAEHSCFRADPIEKVLLGEILFDFGKDITANKLDNYKESYSSLAKIINKTGKIEMFERVLSYQEVFKGKNIIKEPNILEFYNLNN